jgi:hypothetical protein
VTLAAPPERKVSPMHHRHPWLRRAVAVILLNRKAHKRFGKR